MFDLDNILTGVKGEKYYLPLVFLILDLFTFMYLEYFNDFVIFLHLWTLSLLSIAV